GGRVESHRFADPSGEDGPSLQRVGLGDVQHNDLLVPLVRVDGDDIIAELPVPLTRQDADGLAVVDGLSSLGGFELRPQENQTAYAGGLGGGGVSPFLSAKPTGGQPLVVPTQLFLKRILDPLENLPADEDADQEGDEEAVDGPP